VLAACAVGPSTRVSTGVGPVLARSNTAAPSAARTLLDSLDAARAADPAGGPTPAADSARAPASRPLPVPARLALDPARDLAWLDVLRDPQLVAFVTEAVAHNPDLREAQGRVREFRAQLGAARSGFFPQLSATGTTSRNQVAFGPQVVGFDAVRATADLSWELDFWGRVRRGARPRASTWARARRTCGRPPSRSSATSRRPTCRCASSTRACASRTRRSPRAARRSTSRGGVSGRG
jgi:multidrug efflux system outer membrane protein